MDTRNAKVRAMDHPRMKCGTCMIDHILFIERGSIPGNANGLAWLAAGSQVWPPCGGLGFENDLAGDL